MASRLIEGRLASLGFILPPPGVYAGEAEPLVWPGRRRRGAGRDIMGGLDNSAELDDFETLPLATESKSESDSTSSSSSASSASSTLVLRLTPAAPFDLGDSSSGRRGVVRNGIPVVPAALGDIENRESRPLAPENRGEEDSDCRMLRGWVWRPVMGRRLGEAVMGASGGETGSIVRDIWGVRPARNGTVREVGDGGRAGIRRAVLGRRTFDVPSTCLPLFRDVSRWQQ